MVIILHLGCWAFCKFYLCSPVSIALQTHHEHLPSVLVCISFFMALIHAKVFNSFAPDEALVSCLLCPGLQDCSLRSPVVRRVIRPV